MAIQYALAAAAMLTFSADVYRDFEAQDWRRPLDKECQTPR
jgi:hypothetical protein